MRTAAFIISLALVPLAAAHPGRGGGSGISISGSYSGGHWSISGHVGTSLNHLGGGRGGCHGGSPFDLIWDGRNWYVPAGSYYYPYATSYRGFMQPIDTTVPRVNPQLLPGAGSPTVDPSKPAPQPPPPPPTTVEKARAATKSKTFPDAIKLFKEHLKTTADDTTASRQLSIALVESKDLDAGISLLRELYRKDPTLAEKPYVGADCGQDSTRLRDMVAKLSAHAHKSGSPSAWLGVVVLMQADGRAAQAAKMLEKAKAAGLETEVVSRFAAVFNPPKQPVKGQPQPAATPAPGPAPSSNPAPNSNPTPGPSANPPAPAEPASNPMPGPAPEPKKPDDKQTEPAK